MEEPVISFERDLGTLKPKMMNDDYALSVYRALCNVHWAYKTAPDNWDYVLAEQEKQWRVENNKWFRKIPRDIISLLRKPIIKIAYPSTYNKNSKVNTRPFWSNLNIFLMNLSDIFLVQYPTDPPWFFHCSWRSAGSIVAEIRDIGEDYIDFYCSSFEGTVTAEFAQDMYNLGWTYRCLDQVI